ncbi:MAG: glycoside hydrolase family 140 protein [Bacteroidales bacterium]|nr:glycoside hydrolase family 140 protein [Bacteroidales bacterium]
MRFYLFLCLILARPALLSGQSSGDLPKLEVSGNHRYLQTENGDPLFWLGDTGWLLFSKLNREEAEHYLDDRARKGFNVIQVMVLHQLKITNVYGDSALVRGDASAPVVSEGNSPNDPDAYDYWDHIDYIVELAEERGIYLAMVPVWGSNVRQGLVNREQASDYAAWLAERYAGNSNIIWLNGGDIKGSDSTAIWEIIGQQLRNNDPDHLISFHPFGRTQSSMWFHQAGWLDFNMCQSGHRRYDQDDTDLGYGEDNWRYIQDDYLRWPAKPTLDGEPSYEGIPQGLHDTAQPFWDEDDIRRYAYWSVFAGACGFTYGHNAVMQFHKSGDTDPAYGVREYWTEALDAPGASQMLYLKQLILSRPCFDRVPDPSLIAEQQGKQYDYLAAMRGKDYVYIYTCTGREIPVVMGLIQGEKVRASWYNPRTGEMKPIGEFLNSGVQSFDPPGQEEEGNDRVLVLELI